MYTSYKAVISGHKPAYFSPFLTYFSPLFHLPLKNAIFFLLPLSEIFPFSLLQCHLKVGLKTNDSKDVEQNLHHLPTAHA
jgi:hypothetical protein